MAEQVTSEFEPSGLHTVRPYLVVGDAGAAIEFYGRVFGAAELERFTTPAGGVAHAKVKVGDAILEMGEHPSARARDPEDLPRVGLRLYVTDIDATFERAIEAGATGDAPSDRPQQGVRGATVHDPFGLTWWLAKPLE